MNTDEDKTKRQAGLNAMNPLSVHDMFFPLFPIPPCPQTLSRRTLSPVPEPCPRPPNLVPRPRTLSPPLAPNLVQFRANTNHGEA